MLRFWPFILMIQNSSGNPPKLYATFHCSVVGWLEGDAEMAITFKYPVDYHNI